jgi:hypothetical protein
MPTLKQRKDGIYIIHHFYRQNSTWQIDRAGVWFLRDRGVRDNQPFDTSLFMELWERGLVYTSKDKPGTR